MPWVDSDLCTGCGLCVDECPVDIITMNDDVAEIDMDGCIRCGICHDICPVDAIKHDRLKMPEEVHANVAKTQEWMAACEKYLDDSQAGQKCLKRAVRHFENIQMAAEKTIEELKKLKM